jgi:DNA-binding MarR family transcriptional regulator
VTSDLLASSPHAGIRRSSVLAWLRLARTFHKIERRSEDAMRVRGMTMAQFDVLSHVGADPGITQQELANSLLVTKGNVCQLLDRMERTGLIERRQEGRANRLFLTEQGQETYAHLVPAHEDMIALQFAALSDDEQHVLLELLRKLDQSLAPPPCCQQ